MPDDRDEHEVPQGRRKDGRPYMEGNTREDGSYRNGKSRAPEEHRFKAGDGRARGRRPKGTRNLATEWKEELAETVIITENGVQKRRTKLRAVVKQTTARAMKGSDRASEIVFRNAPGEERSAQLSLTDQEIIAQWLAQRGGGNGTTTDDKDLADD